MLHLDYASFRFPPSPRVIKVLKTKLNGINEYPNESYIQLKQKLADVYKLNTRNFLIGNGLDEVIDLITRAFVGERMEVIIPFPTFSQFEKAATRANATAVGINCMHRNYEIKIDEVLDRVSKKTKLIWICCPNNPTGDFIPKERIRKIAQTVNFPVVVDNALGDFSDDSIIDLIGINNIIILRTFSKGYCLAGLRIGYAIADFEYINKIESKKQIFNVNSLAADAAIAALEDQKYYDKLWLEFKKERQRVIKNIKEMGITITGSQSNFILMDFGTEIRSRDVYEKLLKDGIKVFPGWDEEFSGLSGRFLRAVIGRKEQDNIFLTSLKKIMRTSHPTVTRSPNSKS